MQIKTLQRTLLLLLLISSTFSLLTACSSQQTQEKQNPAQVKVIDGNDDAEFKEPAGGE